MVGTTALAEIAALVDDPARANMLAALMDGRALTAAQLARTAFKGAYETAKQAIASRG